MAVTTWDEVLPTAVGVLWGFRQSLSESLFLHSAGFSQRMPVSDFKIRSSTSDLPLAVRYLWDHDTAELYVSTVLPLHLLWLGLSGNRQKVLADVTSSPCCPYALAYSWLPVGYVINVYNNVFFNSTKWCSYVFQAVISRQAEVLDTLCPCDTCHLYCHVLLCWSGQCQTPHTVVTQINTRYSIYSMHTLISMIHTNAMIRVCASRLCL